MQQLISSWGYPAIFLFTVLEAACIPIPSEITLGLGGALASGAFLASGHHLELPFVILVGVAGEMVGSFAAYLVGRTGGRTLVDRVGKYLLLSHRDLDRAEAWFDRHGEAAVLVARVVPVARAFVSLPAGMAEMAPVRFGLYSVIGVAAWVSALASIGYALGGTWHRIVSGFGAATYVLGALFVVSLAAGLVHRYRVVRDERNASLAPAPDQPTSS